tara:strand:- start:21680 stop:22021 length:342 start_codon:yes stop_codon:yes gene_type:complete
MADVIGMSDVSSPDTGKGSKLKTGGGRRKHNMPSKTKCDKDWKKLGYTSAAACKNYKKPAKPQKAGTSSKQEQDKIGWDMAESKNVRMKNRFKRISKLQKPSKKIKRPKATPY